MQSLPSLFQFFSFCLCVFWRFPCNSVRSASMTRNCFSNKKEQSLLALSEDVSSALPSLPEFATLGRTKFLNSLPTRGWASHLIHLSLSSSSAKRTHELDGQHKEFLGHYNWETVASKNESFLLQSLWKINANRSRKQILKLKKWKQCAIWCAISWQSCHLNYITLRFSTCHTSSLLISSLCLIWI